MVLGYEIAGRIDEALTPGRMERGFHGSVSTVFGGAVTTGTLLGLSPKQMSHAIALAATSIGGIAISADTSWAREYHAGLSASLGVHAAYAAEQGFTGEPTVLDGPRGFISAMGGQITADITLSLGESWDIVTDMAIKLMPGGHPYHAVAEAAANAATAGQVDPADVARIILSAAQFTYLPGPIHPTDLIGAAHSIAYFAAAGVADRGFTWEHITNAAKMSEPSIYQLLEKVELDPRPQPLPDRFPHRHGATVTIVMKNGQSHSHTCKSPKGSGARGIDWVDIDEKYKKLVPLSGLSATAIDTTLDLIHEFNSVEHVQALSDCLGK
jgi:2-methylcitrate dehydratase PrpD